MPKEKPPVADLDLIDSADAFFERAATKRGHVDTSFGRFAVQTWTWDQIKAAADMRRSSDPLEARRTDAWLLAQAVLKGTDGPLLFDTPEKIERLGKMDSDRIAELMAAIGRFSDVDAEAVVRAGLASAGTKDSDSTSD